MKQTLSALTLEILATIVQFLPAALRYPLVRTFGWFYGAIPHQQKKALEFNFEHLLGLKGEKLKETTRETFMNFAVTLGDFFIPSDITVEVPEIKKIEELRKKHGGILMLTFHMGHWELGARTMREWGWPVTAVYQPYTNPTFKRIIEKRRASGVNFLPVGQGAAQGVRNALKRGDMVAMLGDHPFGEDGCVVNILERRVLWPKGPVLLAVKSKAPILVAVIVRTRPHHYKAIITDPLIPRNASRLEVDRLVQEVGNKFGMLLKQFPTQWYRLRKLEFVD